MREESFDCCMVTTNNSMVMVLDIAMRRIFSLVKRLQCWVDSPYGQTFLNYSYSWGASIVILGALFKLTNLPGADFMLYVGMGTEVVVFFISAFDDPLSKGDTIAVASQPNAVSQKVADVYGIETKQLDGEIADLYKKHKVIAERQLSIAGKNITELDRLNKSIHRLNDVYDSVLEVFGRQNEGGKIRNGKEETA